MKSNNITLIGLPGSGKTYLGKKLARLFNLRFVDTDALIVAKCGPIPEIFKNKGENYFRNIESEIINEIFKGDDQVISVGGGAILQNSEIIKNNSTVIYVKVPLKILYTRIRKGTRPLVNSYDDLVKLHNERQTIYETSADIIINRNECSNN